MSPHSELLQAGLVALEQHHYAEAIALLEKACQSDLDPTSDDYARSRINLVKAYQRCGKIQPALTLCRELTNHPHPKIQAWAQQALRSLSAANQASSVHQIHQSPASQAIASPPVQESTPASQTRAPTQSSYAELQTLFKTGKTALQQKAYAEAVQALEAYCHQADPANPDYPQAQIWLAKAYKGNHQIEEATALAKQLTALPDQMVQTWAQQFLGSLKAVAILHSGSLAQSSNSESISSQAATPPILQLKSVSELQRFYQEHLIYDLHKIEKERQIVLKQVLICSGLFLGLPLLLAGWLLSIGANFSWVLVGYALALTLWVGVYSQVTSNYAKTFKEFRIVEKLVHGIDPNLTYSPYGLTINYSIRNAFTESQLFKHYARPDRFVEDDSVSGQIGETFLAFSEICAESQTTDFLRDDQRLRAMNGISYVVTRLLRGQRLVFDDFLNEVYGDVSRTDIFKGIFFVANFNKRFQFKTFVFPDFEQWFGGLGTKLQSLNKQHGQLVKLEDPMFEKLFTVYADDQVEARYLLSTSLMDRLVRFRKKSGRDLSIAFVNNAIYVAIAYDEDLFEPKLYTSMLNFKPIQDYFENLQLVIGIVEDLNLNRRIWTA
jgi:outer membrane protein assembly factor BamD (BamD/ComL family)